jgi:hypothetical protein
MSEDGPVYRAAPADVPFLEALIIDRDAVIRMMRIALEEMHSRRVITPHFSGERDIAQMIRYWDAVFGWIKEQRGEDLVLMSRRTF